MHLVLPVFSTFLLGLILTFVARFLANKIGAVALPKKDRWHKKPTALLGGVSILLSFLIGYFIFGPKSRTVYLILTSSTFLFFVGLIDDFRKIKPHTKLIAQLIASGFIVYFGLKLPWTSSGALNSLITIIWLVGITNAINLLDNMDGLATGISLIACFFLSVTFLLNGQDSEALLPMLLGGSLLGFLIFNFYPATIFMGDCGSMFLGFMLSGVALLSDYGRSRNLGAILLTPVLILLIPIFDTSMVTITRKLSGRHIRQGGRDHVSHRLVALGLSERRSVFVLYSFAAFSGILALMVRLLHAEELLLLIPALALIILFIGFSLAQIRVDVHEDKSKSQ